MNVGHKTKPLKLYHVSLAEQGINELVYAEHPKQAAYIVAKMAKLSCRYWWDVTVIDEPLSTKAHIALQMNDEEILA